MPRPISSSGVNATRRSVLKYFSPRSGKMVTMTPVSISSAILRMA
jgi:hypothetical protein